MNSDAAPKPVVCLERAELERIESAKHVPLINDRALINTHYTEARASVGSRRPRRARAEFLYRP